MGWIWFIVGGIFVVVLILATQTRRVQKEHRQVTTALDLSPKQRQAMAILSFRLSVVRNRPTTIENRIKIGMGLLYLGDEFAQEIISGKPITDEVWKTLLDASDEQTKIANGLLDEVSDFKMRLAAEGVPTVSTSPQPPTSAEEQPKS